MDIKRSLHSFDCCKQYSDEFKEAKQAELQEIVDAVIVKIGDKNGKVPNYYQGFHDVSSVMLLVLRKNLAFYALDVVARTYFAQYLAKPFNENLFPLMTLIFVCLKEIDPQLYKLISDDEM